MLLSSLILSATFLGSMAILMKMPGEEKSSPSNNNIDVHIHNTFDDSSKRAEDYMTESKVMQELDRIREELKKEQELDMRARKELDRINEHIRKSKIVK
jgi:hypothetical protein